MQIAKGYFQDRLVLLLLSLNVFAVVITAIFMGLRLTSISSESYFVQYRSNFGEPSYKTGGLYNLLIVIAFVALVAIFHGWLSYKTYNIRKQLSLVLLCMSILLVIVALIVGNALIALR